jgi:outer membrane immunogenic protein
MRRVSAPVFAAAAMLAVPAFAADLPVKVSPPPRAAAFSWTGCYGGFNAGGAKTTTDVSYIQGGGFLLTSPLGDRGWMTDLASPAVSKTGFTGGGQLGCNYQTGSMVLGVETDINYLHTDASYFATGLIPSSLNRASSTVTASTDWLYTLRGRVGVTVDRALLYATGGLAVGNEKFSQTFFHFVNSSVEAGSASSVKAGWTAGAGIEYAITNSLSAKLEYLHVELPSTSFTAINSVLSDYNADNRGRLREDIVRLGLNWKFAAF